MSHVIVIGHGINLTATTIAALHSTSTVMLSLAKTKQSPFEPPPFLITAVPRHTDTPFIKEPKNYINGKQKKRRY